MADKGPKTGGPSGKILRLLSTSGGTGRAHPSESLSMRGVKI